MRHNPRKFRLARKWSNEVLRQIAPLAEGDVVNASAGEDIDKEGATYSEYFSGATSYTLTNYKSGSFRGFRDRDNELELDLTAALPDSLADRFDVVFNHTVLEHIFDVIAAFANLCTMSRDLVIVVVPFCQQQHEEPDYGDYWRFTPTCIRKLFEINGLDTVFEAANNEFNVASYLLAVGSKHPERWATRMPASDPIYPAAGWVGNSPWQEWKRSVRAKLSLFGGRSETSHLNEQRKKAA